MSKGGKQPEDITPTELVLILCDESKGYEKYRKEFKPAYTQMLSNVGLEETDYSQNRAKGDLKCATLNQQLVQIATMTSQELFLNEIRPIFDNAVRVENEIYQQIKKSLQVFYDFYANEFELKKAEFASLGPELESIQKNKTAALTPEQIQHRDKVTSRFTDLQRLLKKMYQPGVDAIQQSHLKTIREVFDLCEKLNDQLVMAFAPVEKMTFTVKKHSKNDKAKQLKAKKLSQDDKDV